MLKNYSKKHFLVSKTMVMIYQITIHCNSSNHDLVANIFYDLYDLSRDLSRIVLKTMSSQFCITLNLFMKFNRALKILTFIVTKSEYQEKIKMSKYR